MGSFMRSGYFPVRGFRKVSQSLFVLQFQASGMQWHHVAIFKVRHDFSLMRADTTLRGHSHARPHWTRRYRFRSGLGHHFAMAMILHITYLMGRSYQRHERGFGFLLDSNVQAAFTLIFLEQRRSQRHICYATEREMDRSVVPISAKAQL